MWPTFLERDVTETAQEVYSGVLEPTEALLCPSSETIHTATFNYLSIYKVVLS